VFQHPSHLAMSSAQGTFVPPTLIELNHIGELQREVFGPVLHLVRYARATWTSCSTRSTPPATA
jgi:RHH-type proline utilization regulon transcriptional repressor/proline dehydrogenase/delta 1-pyrroline-5-carboxylate dehydrogenase